MQFDFDTVYSRREQNSLKWDVGQEELPMWVADMDFKTAPAITEAIREKAAGGMFGYGIIPDSWYEAIRSWWERRYALQISREWLAFTTGVVPAVSSIVRSLTDTGDSVVMLTPVYHIFFHSVENNGRHVQECPMIYQVKEREYTVDYHALEEKLADPLTTLLIFCNPHNPGGKLWTRDEIVKIGQLCEKHHVTVLSDEIHCDLTDPGTRYVPFASVWPHNSVTCLSPSKSFNMAGLQSAAVMIPDEWLRNRVVRGLNKDEVAEPNYFAIEAAQAAYSDGEAWLEALREYLAENKKVAAAFLEEQIPGIRLCRQEATYLLWLDCREITEDSAQLAGQIREKTGLYLSDGTVFRGDGRYFLRLNIACPRSVLLDGLQRLKNGICR